MKQLDEKQDLKYYLDEKHMSIPKILVRKYCSGASKSDQEDLISEGYIGLMEALNTYDPLSYVTFRTYASRCIINRINDFNRKLKRWGDGEVRDAELELDDGISFIESSLEDTEMTDERLIRMQKDERVHDIIMTFFFNLSIRQQTIVRARLLSIVPMTQEELAKTFDCSRQMIAKEESYILNLIREACDEKDIQSWNDC